MPQDGMVIGYWADPTGKPLVGQIGFIPAASNIRDTRGERPTGVEGAVTAKLVGGAITISLTPNSGEGINPTDWNWLVVFDLRTTSGYSVKKESFYIDVAPGATVDLVEATPVGESEGQFIIQGPKGDPGQGASPEELSEILGGPSADLLSSDGSVVKNRLPDLSGDYAGLVQIEDLQTVLDALPSYVVGDPKRHVRVARGETVVSAPIKIPSGVVLDLTQGVRITLAAGSSCDVITNSDWVNGNSDIEILGGYLNGNRTEQVSAVADGPGQSLITLVNVARFKVSGVEGTSSFLHGLDMNVRNLAGNSFNDPGCTDGIVEHCRFTDFGDDGISPHWSHGISIVACENFGGAGSYSSSSNGIELDDGSSDITVTGCITHDVANGIQVQGHAGRIPCRRVTITGHISYNCSRAGLTITQPDATNPDEPGRGVFVNGLIVRDSHIGIRLDNYRTVRVQGLHLENVDDGVYINETVPGSVSNVEILGGEMMGITSQKVIWDGTATSSKAKVNLLGGIFSDSIWIPAERLLAQGGSPELRAVGPTGREMTCWMLDASADESLHALFPVPSDWVWLAVDIWWMNPQTGTPATSVAWQVNRSAVTPGITVNAEAQGVVRASASAAQNVVNSTSGVLNNSAVDVTQMLRLEIVRAASNALDTYAADAALLGVMVRRVK